MDWETVPDIEFAARASLPFAPMCTNRYDAKKLRTFLRNMDGDWAIVHLSQDAPLIMEVSTADKSTQHLIVVASKEDEEEVAA